VCVDTIVSVKSSGLGFTYDQRFHLGQLRNKDLFLYPGSVSLELRDLEGRRHALQAEVGAYNQKIDDLKTTLVKHQTDLERLKISVEQVTIYIQRKLRKAGLDHSTPHH